MSDELTIAAADRLSGDERITKLDESADHPGPLAEEARARAQKARVEVVQAALAAKQPAEALTRLDRWSTELAKASEAPELARKRTIRRPPLAPTPRAASSRRGRQTQR